MVAVFSKATGAFLFLADKVQVTVDIYDTKDYPTLDGNLADYDYIGTYDDGDIYNTTDPAYIDQLDHITLTIHDDKTLRDSLTDRIYDKHGYPIHKQINLMMDAVGQMLQATGQHHDEFSKMHTVINAERNHFKSSKEMYQNDNDSLYLDDSVQNSVLDRSLQSINSV